MGQQIESALAQSLHRVLVVLVSFLPGVLAFLFAVLVFTGLGFLISWVIRRLLGSIRFDERLSARQTSGGPSNLTDWSPSQSPTLLISRVVFWSCVLVGLGVGVSAFDASYQANSQFSLFLLPYFTHITGAIIIILVGSLLARFLSRTILIGAVNAQLQYARFLALGVKWLVLVLTGAMALDHLRIGGAIVELAFGILFGGIVLTLSLAIGLGSRDLVSRSIEKTMERPNFKPSDIGPTTGTEGQPRPKLRHF